MAFPSVNQSKCCGSGQWAWGELGLATGILEGFSSLNSSKIAMDVAQAAAWHWGR